MNGGRDSPPISKKKITEAISAKILPTYILQRNVILKLEILTKDAWLSNPLLERVRLVPGLIEGGPRLKEREYMVCGQEWIFLTDYRLTCWNICYFYLCQERISRLMCGPGMCISFWRMENTVKLQYVDQGNCHDKHVHRIDLNNDAKCRLCDNVYEDFPHIFCNCIVKRCKNHGTVYWQDTVIILLFPWQLSKVKFYMKVEGNRILLWSVTSTIRKNY